MVRKFIFVKIFFVLDISIVLWQTDRSGIEETRKMGNEAMTGKDGD